MRVKTPIVVMGIATCMISLIACTSIENRYSWDDSHSAKIFGIDRCHVSVPLDDDTAIARIRQDVSDASKDSDVWKRLQSKRLDGDEIRYVACLGTYVENGKKLLSGSTYLALVRQHRIVDSAFMDIIN